MAAGRLLKVNALFVLNRLLDLLFLIDLILQFFIMYTVTSKYGATQVYDQRMIVKLNSRPLWKSQPSMKPAGPNTKKSTQSACLPECCFKPVSTRSVRQSGTPESHVNLRSLPDRG